MSCRNSMKFSSPTTPQAVCLAAPHFHRGSPIVTAGPRLLPWPGAANSQNPSKSTKMLVAWGKIRQNMLIIANIMAFWSHVFNLLILGFRSWRQTPYELTWNPGCRDIVGWDQQAFPGLSTPFCSIGSIRQIRTSSKIIKSSHSDLKSWCSTKPPETSWNI